MWTATLLRAVSRTRCESKRSCSLPVADFLLDKRLVFTPPERMSEIFRYLQTLPLFVTPRGNASALLCDHDFDVGRRAVLDEQSRVTLIPYPTSEIVGSHTRCHSSSTDPGVDKTASEEMDRGMVKE